MNLSIYDLRKWSVVKINYLDKNLLLLLLFSILPRSADSQSGYSVSDLGSGSASTIGYLQTSEGNLLIPEPSPSSSVEGHSLPISQETTQGTDLLTSLSGLQTPPISTSSHTQSSSTVTTPTTAAIVLPSMMVEVPPDGTSSLPRVAYIVIPVGLGFVLVSVVLVLCGSFVCFKRRSKYATETPRAMNRQAEGYSIKDAKEGESQAEWNDVDCTKFELPLETVHTFGVTSPTITDETFPDLQTIENSFANSAGDRYQPKMGPVTSQGKEAASLTFKMKPSRSVGAITARNAMFGEVNDNSQLYDVPRSVADQMGLIVNKGAITEPPGRFHASKRALSTGALHQHGVANATTQYLPSSYKKSHYHQVPSNIPVSDVPGSSTYDVPRSVMENWPAENIGAIGQLRVQVSSDYDVPRSVLATRHELEQPNIQRGILGPSRHTDTPQQNPLTVLTSEDSKPSPYSTYDVPRQSKASTLPSNQVPEGAEDYDVPREWLEAKVAVMNQQGRQAIRNRSYTAFNSRSDEVYNVPRQMLPLKAVNNEQARMQTQREAGIVFCRGGPHGGNLEGVPPPVPRHGMQLDDDSDSDNLYDEPPLSPPMVSNSDTHQFPHLDQYTSSDEEEMYAEPPPESVAEVIQLGLLEERIARAKSGKVNQTVKRETQTDPNSDPKHFHDQSPSSESLRQIRQQLENMTRKAKPPRPPKRASSVTTSTSSRIATELSGNVPYGNRANRQESRKGQPPPVKQKPVRRSTSMHKAKSATLS